MLPKVGAEGKGDSARNGLEEAGGKTCEPTDRNRIGRLSLRVSGHDITKPDGSGGRVNAAVVHGQFTFLSGEICLTGIRVTVSAFMTNPEAPFLVTGRVSRQKSAEGIVVLWDEGPNGEVSGGFPYARTRR